jgi:hypothetical protein
MRIALREASMLVRRARPFLDWDRSAPAELAAANEIVAGARLE